MKNSAVLRVFAAILLATLAGILTEKDTTVLDINLIQLYGVVGQLFLNALKLIAIPLVASSIIIATARMGSDSAFKVMGMRSFRYFILTSFLAMVVGFICVSLFQPGVGQEGIVGLGYIPLEQLQAMQADANISAFEKIELLLMRMVPVNIIEAAAEGQILGIIVFCSFFGFLSSQIEATLSKTVLTLFQAIFEIMMKMTHLLMYFLPIGVFALIAKVIATTGLEAIGSVISFFGVVLAALAITCGIIYPILLKTLGKTDPLKHIKAIFPALITAFSTSSSAATMPVTIECLEEKLGVSPRVCNFFVPLATAINMPGTALHVAAAVCFLAQVYGVSMETSTQAMVLLMTLLTSFGVAGVPSGSLFAIVTVMTLVGLPSEGIVLILVVERLLDMCRTAANVYANSCCAVLIAKTEENLPISEETSSLPAQVS